MPDLSRCSAPPPLFELLPPRERALRCTSGGWIAEQLRDVAASSLGRHAQVRQKFSAKGFGVVDDSKQQVLGADIVVVELFRSGKCTRNRVFCASRLLGIGGARRGDA